MKANTIALLRKADVSEVDWLYPIIEQITDKYAKGYLTRLSEELDEPLGSSSEEYRERLITACGWAIWGK